MRAPLVAVGSNPPRSMRGKTILPDGAVSTGAWWVVRVVVGLVMTIVAPASLLVTAWWVWGLRKRRWRWPTAVVGLVAAVVMAALVPHPLGGVRLWLAVAGHYALTFRGTPIGGGVWSWTVLAAGGWIVGTPVGCWMGFLAWWRTPPWRERARPKGVVARWSQRRLERALSSGAGDLPGVITFGIDTDTGKAVELPWSQVAGHMLIVGSPESGKTTTASRVVRASIRDGQFTAVVDMKASPLLTESVVSWCTRWGRPLWVFSIEGPSRYDPFRHGDYTRKRDLLMATGQWSDPYYQSKAADYLLAVFYVMDLLTVTDLGWLPTVSKLLDPRELAQAAYRLPAGDPRARVAQERVTNVIEEASNTPAVLSGLTPRVRALTDTIMGRWVAPGDPQIDLIDIWDQGGVVLFSLPTLTHPDSAAAFGSLAVQDLKTLAGVLQERKNTHPGLVFVDEFAPIGAGNLTTALAMSRESRLSWALATQDLGDLAVGDDGLAYVQKVLTDTNIKVIHTVGDSDTAERLAKLAGAKWGVKERTAINQADSALDVTTGTQSGHGFVDHLLVPVLEPSDILNQGMGRDSRFTILNKSGQWVCTGAHTIPDRSVTTAAPTAPLHVPARFLPDYLAAGELVDEPVDAFGASWWGEQP